MKKIIVVNNDIDSMSLLQTWLKRNGFNALYTGNAENLRTLIEDFKPDLLIIDIMQNGLVEELKNDPLITHIPVLVMTGYTIPREQAVASKGDDFIQKPFDLPDLKKKVDTLLRLH